MCVGKFFLFSLINLIRSINVALVHNVLHIAEGGDLEAGTFNIAQMIIQGTNFNFNTTPPLLAMCCYTLYYFFLCVGK
jgi:hypothetical protein